MRTAIATAVVLALGCQEGDGDGDSDSDRVRDAKIEFAQRQVGQLNFEAYPMWAVRVANADRCPTVAQLREFVSRAPTDPWGARAAPALR